MLYQASRDALKSVDCVGIHSAAHLQVSPTHQNSSGSSSVSTHHSNNKMSAAHAAAMCMGRRACFSVSYSLIRRTYATTSSSSSRHGIVRAAAAAAAVSPSSPSSSSAAATQQSNNHKPLIMLGIESSCDDTGVAVVTSDGRVLGEALATQAELHAPWGGVVPSIAQAAHKEAIDRQVVSSHRQHVATAVCHVQHSTCVAANTLCSLAAQAMEQQTTTPSLCCLSLLSCVPSMLTPQQGG